MEILRIVVPILVGATIGYCTNYLAIKMLFRPRKAIFIGNWQLPFTPGIIPKNQKRIAAAVGRAVGGHLLNSDAIKEGLGRNGTKEKMVKELAAYICESESCIREFFPEGERHDAVVDKVGDILSIAVVERAKQADFKSIVAKIGEETAGEILNNKMVALVLNEERKDAIFEKIGQAVQKYINDNGEQAVKSAVIKNFTELEEKPIKELVAAGIDREGMERLILSLVDHAVLHYGPTLLQNIDISGIVRQRVEDMDMAELEELILSVMKAELQAVINLGALLGAVIGIINIFI